MARIVVVGGAMIGSAAAMMLARDGHDVTVLESDPSPPPPPEEAWDTWDRKGVSQFHQPHNVFPRFRVIAQAELPDMVERMRDAGFFRWDFLQTMPPFITDREPRPGDDRFWSYTGRRPVIESIFATAAMNEPRVTFRRGVRVRGLLTGASASGVPHVTGVVTDDGSEIRGDLVVDASGRRSGLADWLRDVGGTPPYEEAEDVGFIYYTRFFRGTALPPLMGPPVNPLGTFSLLTLPADNTVWSVTLWIDAHDRALKELRHAEKFTNVVRACPLHAHWLEGEPITDVMPISGVVDRYRRFVVDGRAVATGVAAVGDAWACTNPSAGRGLSVGMIHAQRLRAAVRSSLDDPARFAEEWDAVTENEVAPFYRSQIRADRARFAEVRALREGRPPPPPDPLFVRAGAAVMHDADVFRAFIEMNMCLAAPDEVLARPEIREKIASAPAPAKPSAMPAPSREELLTLVA